MIIQCDQCNTKFKLDDAKVSERGTKVRCSKCKHIFIVQKEVPHEEPDLDSLLSGLGASVTEAEAPAPQTREDWRLSAEEATPRGEEPREEAPAGSTGTMGGNEFGEDFFATSEEASPEKEAGEEFGEFPFPEERGVAPSGAESAPKATAGESEGFDFGEFPFEEEQAAVPPAPSVAEAAPEKTAEFDFGEFSFDEEKPVAAAESPEAAPAASEETGGFDFGDVDLGTGEPSKEGTAGFSAGGSSEDLFSFGEEPAVGSAGIAPRVEPESPEKTGEGFDFESFAVPSPEGGVGEDLTASEPSAFVLEGEKKAGESEPLDFGDIDFGESVGAGSVPSKMEAASPVAGTALAPEPQPQVSTVSFPPPPPAEEELPPLSIATRKKGSSVIPMAVTAIAALIVLAIAGVGFYVFREGPAAFDKLGLGFLAKWAGLEVAEEGGIVIRNPAGAFMVNKEAGEIFVISGEAVNNFRKPRASIQVKGIVLGAKGAPLMQKVVYCGNALSKEQLTTLPMAKIEAAMGNQFGDSLSNLGVQPGKGIPFVVVFSGVPKDAAEFSVEVVGSTVATQ